MGSEQEIGDEKSQYGITQKFELFIIPVTDRSLVRMGTVRQRFCEELRVLEGVTKLELQIFNRTHKIKVGKCIYRPLSYYAGLNVLLPNLLTGGLDIIVDALV